MYLISLLFTIFYSLTSFASVKLDKYFIKMEGTQRNESLYITNGDKNSLENKRYGVDFVNYKQMADGSYKLVENEEINNKFADKFLLVSPKRFTLEPGGSQLVKIHRKPFNAQTEDGEYKTHLRIQEIPESKPTTGSGMKKKQVAFEITGIFGITIPVIVQKGMNLISSAEISDALYNVQNNESFLKVTIRRNGNAHVTGNIIVENNKGKEIGRADRFTIFTSTDSRYINIKLSENSKRYTVKYMNIENTEVIAVKYINN